MDIEGAEYAVLRNTMTRGPRLEVLCVEFDEIRNALGGDHQQRIAEAVEMVKAAGYMFARLEDSNALILRRN